MDKLNPEFADSGSKDADVDFDAWADTGYLDERVRYKGLNKVLNRSDSKINDAIERLPQHVADDAGELPLIQGLFTPANDFSNAAADLNTFDLSGGLTGNIRDFCYAKVSGVRKLFIVSEDISTGSPVSVFDIATGVVTGGGDLSASLPSGGSQTWYPMSICCDATNCYVLWVDTNASPDTHQVQAYALSDFSVPSAWPATGLALTAGAVAYDDDQARIRNATDTKLVVTQPWVAVSSGTSAGLNIVSKTDGTSDGVGAGNVGSVSAGQVSAVCSDGTTVFFPVELAATVSICGMTIASPGANGPSGINWPGGGSFTPAEFGGIACSGNIIVSTWADTSTIFHTHGPTNGTLAKYVTADAGKCYKLGPVCFDGKSFWSLGEREVSSTGTVYRAHVFKLRGVDRGGYNASADPYHDAVADGELFVDAYATADITSNTGAVINSYDSAIMIADGRDIWFADTAALYRLARANTR